ncbi:GNAT family N-acetyltransferase [Heyndrickxia acidicola]|uniref:GNAT family N-acetyltransferase n=1 Tax=Heyndrickxia acidicola TaxID=209389 RepID=A0ABU6MD73_9BACI|nr:GNAT family N-acetyltransferase [Heyndrickxia acidicola]MED1202615.1 GNAT family N-acetyltransferase [Heyndrickxia acidicola]
MIIRDAMQEELNEIREQRIHAYSEYSKAVSTAHWLALKQAISVEASLPGVEWIVAELDGKIHGSVALFPPNTDAYDGYIDELDYYEIRMLAVHPEARGKGTAASLVSECIRRTKEKGSRFIGLHTADFMVNAIKLYEKMGFERYPQFDFEPSDDGVIVKAFRLTI